MFCGNPQQVADQMEEWFTAPACDGFVLAASSMPGAYDDVVRLLVPELQHRRLFQKEYAGPTLRDNLGWRYPGPPIGTRRGARLCDNKLCRCAIPAPHASGAVDMKPSSPPLRSFLFAPGNHARRVANALSLDADVVILDLEDAVATAEKPAARGAVAAALSRPRRSLLYVRVNAADTEFCYGDLVAIVGPGLDGIVLPKVESATALATIDWLLAQLEREQDLAPGAIGLIPIIETAGGLTNLDIILAAGTRVRHAAFGAGDFTLDVNMAWSRTEAELAFARARIATASRAAGIEAPLDTVWVDLADEEGLEMSARTALGFGFQGKMCIHPKQIAPVHRALRRETQRSRMRSGWSRRSPRRKPRAVPRSSSTANSSTTRSFTGRKGFWKRLRPFAQRTSSDD